MSNRAQWTKTIPCIKPRLTLHILLVSCLPQTFLFHCDTYTLFMNSSPLSRTVSCGIINPRSKVWCLSHTHTLILARLLTASEASETFTVMCMCTNQMILFSESPEHRVSQEQPHYAAFRFGTSGLKQQHQQPGSLLSRPFVKPLQHQPLDIIV